MKLADWRPPSPLIIILCVQGTHIPSGRLYRNMHYEYVLSFLIYSSVSFHLNSPCSFSSAFSFSLTAFGAFSWQMWWLKCANPLTKDRTFVWQWLERMCTLMALYYTGCLLSPAQISWEVLCFVPCPGHRFITAYYLLVTELQFVPPCCLRAHRTGWTTFCAESSPVLLFLVTLNGKTLNWCCIIPRTSAEDCISVRVVLIAIGQSFIREYWRIRNYI